MFFKSIIQYLLRGLLVVIPVSATVYIIFITIQWVDGLLAIPIPGVGFLTVFGTILLIGLLSESIIIKPVIRILEGGIKKIPIVSFIYSSLNDVIGALAGEKKKFNQPVLVPFDEKGVLLKPGFITQEDMTEANMNEYVAVYLPHSYNFSGNLFFVKREKIIAVESKSGDTMRFIVSSGVTGKIKAKQKEQ
jgi:uncharacterized membrane protein